MSMARKNVFGVIAVVFFALGMASYFLPERTYFYLESQQDIDRCEAAVNKDEVRTERYLLLSDYQFLANSISGPEDFGVCPYQDYKVKTYGLEMFAVSIVFVLGSALYARKEKK